MLMNLMIDLRINPPTHCEAVSGVIPGLRITLNFDSRRGDAKSA